MQLVLVGNSIFHPSSGLAPKKVRTPERAYRLRSTRSLTDILSQKVSFKEWFVWFLVKTHQEAGHFWLCASYGLLGIGKDGCNKSSHMEKKPFTKKIFMRSPSPLLNEICPLNWRNPGDWNLPSTSGTTREVFVWAKYPHWPWTTKLRKRSNFQAYVQTLEKTAVVWCCPSGKTERFFSFYNKNLHISKSGK